MKSAQPGMVFAPGKRPPPPRRYSVGSVIFLNRRGNPSSEEGKKRLIRACFSTLTGHTTGYTVSLVPGGGGHGLFPRAIRNVTRARSVRRRERRNGAGSRHHRLA